MNGGDQHCNVTDRALQKWSSIEINYWYTDKELQHSNLFNHCHSLNSSSPDFLVSPSWSAMLSSSWSCGLFSQSVHLHNNQCKVDCFNLAAPRCTVQKHNDPCNYMRSVPVTELLWSEKNAGKASTSAWSGQHFATIISIHCVCTCPPGGGVSGSSSRGRLLIAAC